MVASDRELNTRKAAQAVGAKALHMAPLREAERLTGLKVGGISPLSLLDKHFEIYLDASSADLEELYLSGGQRGLDLRLRVSDLLKVTGATIINATEAPDDSASEEG
jgi:Cys-tRNA(Pro)/Cys-tRNA(Cys) deacylase